MNKTKTTLALAASALAFAASATDVRFTSHGEVQFPDGSSLSVCAFMPGWASRSAMAPFEMPKDGIVRFRIVDDGKDVFTGTAEAKVLDDGKLQATYAFKAVADVEMQTLAVVAAMPAAPVIGRTGRADGHAWKIPAEVGGGFGGGSASSFACPLAGGRELKITSAAKVGYSAQDSRRWGTTWSLRLGENGLKKYRKGDEMKLVLTLDDGERFKLVANKPTVIAEGPRWAKLDYRKDIVAGSALDFSNQGLVDAPAGKYGWTKRVGDHFEFERRPGVAQRFYGVNLCFSACFPNHAETDMLVTRLVRLGYNAIRIHHYDGGCTEGSPDGTALNPVKMERLDYLVAKAIEKGLYVTTDLFVSRKVPWRTIGVDKPGDVPMQLFKTLVMCDDAAFANWCAFSRNLLLHKNPYTERTYLEEPALSLVSLINEGGIFMGWNAEKRTDARIRAAWKSWLAAERKANPAFHPEADAEKLPQGGWGGPQSGVFALFQGWLERRGVRRMAAFLRSLGSRALFTNDNCGPHWTALQAATEDYDYIDDHFYVDHPEFLDKPWQLPSRCGNQNPILTASLPPCAMAFTRLAEKPFTVTEWNFSGPGMYRGVGGIMTGALAAMQDWDGLWRFAYSHGIHNVHDGDWAPGTFDLATDPLSQASDRASICLFLRRDAEPYAKTNGVSLLVTPQSVENGAQALRAAPDWTSAVWERRVSNCLSREGVTGDKVIARERDIDVKAYATFANPAAQVSFDRVRGSMTIDTPRTCGGFAPSGRLVAGPIDITVSGAPATVWASSLDGQPVATSKRILLSHLTDVQGGGTRYADETRQILLRHGKGALVEVGAAAIVLKLAEPGRYKVYELATDGARRGTLATAVKDGALAFEVSTKGPNGARLLYEIAFE